MPDFVIRETNTLKIAITANIAFLVVPECSQKFLYQYLKEISWMCCACVNDGNVHCACVNDGNVHCACVKAMMQEKFL